MEEEILLVDENDLQIGTAEKMHVHLKALRHRAFSVLIYNNAGELLIQKRADTKYHSAGLWANSCCSHPRTHENNIDAAKRRLQEELGFSCDLFKVTEISYNLQLDNDLYENEYTHIFAGIFNGKISINYDEVSEVKWISKEALISDFKINPHHYAKWFELYILKTITNQQKILFSYT